MDFTFDYRVRPSNLWILSMANIYRSYQGVVNGVFTLSMVLLTLRFWAEANTTVRVLLTAGMLLFPLIQPALIFLRSRRITESMPDEMRMDFGGKGMTVTAEDKKSHVDYWDLKSVIRISGMLIIQTRSGQSFVLNSQVLDGRGVELFRYLKKQVK
ncbi:MAG: hypothetical protein JXA95_13820 [Spirochaetales bacterium]|nr:hypothetical protein [Spirochaetales bacterium]